MKIFYWSPHISNVATIKAVYLSCFALRRYNNNISTYIINAIGEWNEYKKILDKKKIELINLSKKNYNFSFNFSGFLIGRFLFFFIFVKSFFPLLNIIKIKKPKYFIAHLITSLPILIFGINNFETKLILRISGYPRGFIRMMFWKLFSKKIYKIFCPTQSTLEYLVKKKIFPREKVFLVKDPVISISDINHQKKIDFENSFNNKKRKYILSIGRLTHQKNFSLAINFMEKISKIDKNIDLVIAGEGSEYNNLKKKIIEKKLENRIYLIGFKKNIFSLLKNASFFLLTSLWEDPGFVLIEAAYCNTFVISSDCGNGPKDIIIHEKNGFKFKNNDINSLLNVYNQFKNLSDLEIFKMKYELKKVAKDYSVFNHYKCVNRCLEVI